MQSLKKSKLILENGLEFHGYSFGYDNVASGEVVFSTAMVGYPESLTDPSYSGQILCMKTASQNTSNRIKFISGR